MGLVEHASHILVRIRNTFLARYDKNNDICFVHGDLSLVFDLFHKRRVNIVYSARINNTKLTIKPICCRIDSVAGHPFDIFYNGNPLTGNPIEKR